MATEVDLQRLVVSLEASFVKYERAWQRAQGLTDANTRQIGTKFDAMSGKIAAAGSGTATALRPIGLQTANIAAQFQDIAVQLQSGQSPFTIALQQGTQLASALGTRGGLKGALSGLAGGFAALVSPVSLATVATIALGGAAVEYFGTLIQDGRVSEETLKKQDDLIRGIADKWGEVVPALREYVNRLDAADSAAKAQEAQTALVSRAWQDVRDTVSSAQISVASLLQDLGDAGVPIEQIQGIRDAFNDLQSKVKTGTATTQDAQRVSAALSAVLTSTSIPAVSRLADTFSILAGAIASATTQAQSFSGVGETVANAAKATEAFVTEQQRLNGLTQDQLDLENEIARVKADAGRAGANLTDEQALALARQNLAAEDRRASAAEAARRREQDAEAADREAQAVLDLIANLEFERQIVGLSAQDQEIMNAVRQAGVGVMSEEGLRIRENIVLRDEERDAIAANTEAMQQFNDIAKSALQGFIQDVLAGKSATESLGNALSGIGSRLLDIGLGNLFPSSGGGILSGLFGGKRATGGPVVPGKAYLVNENTPNSELFVPRVPGTIVPRSGGVGTSAGVTVNLSVDARGAQQGVADQIAARLDVFTRFELPAAVNRIVADPLARG